MQEEIEKMEDDELLENYRNTINIFAREAFKEELLKRLEDGWKYRDLNK